MDHTTAQAVICRHLTTESRVLSHAVQCGFYDGQSVTGVDIIWLFRHYPPNTITLILLMHFYIYCRFYIILTMTVSYINTKEFHAFPPILNATFSAYIHFQSAIQ